MEMRCVFIHVENHRNNILLAECVLQPFQAIVTPIVKSPIIHDAHHVLMRSRKKRSYHPYLVIGYLALYACRLDAVGYCFITPINTTWHLDKFTVEVCPRRVCVVWNNLALYVVGFSCIRIALCFFEI